MPHDYVVERGDVNFEILIITRGAAISLPLSEDAAHPHFHETGTPSHTPFDDRTDSMAAVEFRAGDFFGEMEFLGLSVRYYNHFCSAASYLFSSRVPPAELSCRLQEERTITVRTKRFCEIASLHPRDMEETLRMNVKLRRRFATYATMKQKLVGWLTTDSCLGTDSVWIQHISY